MPYTPYQYYNQPVMQMPQAQPQLQQQVQPQIQNGGFISAPNEAYARNYPVAPGNSVTFKDEAAPYVYAKTMGFSQLDRPIFEKYRLVKEEPDEAQAPDASVDVKPIHKDICDIKSEIELIWEEIEGLKNVPKKAPNRPKTENRGDD